jgi:hypothetical protein
MTLKTTLAALALTLAPGLALAQGCPHDNSYQDAAAISCAQGTVLDAATGKCLPVSS